MTKRILIVDDEDHIREIAQMSLEMVGGWEVITASSGGEAVATAARELPDAILLDVMMPGMDGPTAFKQLQASETTCGIPVILLTAKVLAGDRRRLTDIGVEYILSKPFDPMSLPDQVNEALGWKA